MFNLEEKCSLALSKLMFEKPFFGKISSKLEIVISSDTKTFKLNGTKIESSLAFLQNLTIEELQTLYVYASLYIALELENRKNSRYDPLWQLATRYVIGNILMQNGFNLLDTMLYKEEYKDMYTEEIYSHLLQDSTINEEDKQTHLSEDDNLTLFNEYVKNLISKEDELEKIPLQKLFNIKNSNKISWREHLNLALLKHIKTTSSLMPPSKKLLYTDIYLPSYKSEFFRFVVAIDSSGSIDKELLSLFLSELNYILNSIQNYEIDLLICDNSIRVHQKIVSPQKLDIAILGGGSTSFIPVFDFIDKSITDCMLLIYFSDLLGSFPKKIPTYEVKWVSKELKNVPFGEVLPINS